MSDAIFSELLPVEERDPVFPHYVEIPPMTVAKDKVISTNPEQEVIARLQNWAKNKGIDITKSRAFGFDVPVSAEEKAQGIRGYEYWLQVPDSFVIPDAVSHPEPVEGHAVLVEPSTTVIPAKAGIHTSAVERSETLINDSHGSSVKEWMPDNTSRNQLDFGNPVVGHDDLEKRNGTHAAVIPLKKGIHTSAVERSETLINDSPGSSAKEWMPDQVGHDIKIESFAGGKFIALRITDPFADPFDRIPKGWQTLVKHIKDNNVKVEWCTPGSCLEEVHTIDGICYMDVMIYSVLQK